MHALRSRRRFAQTLLGLSAALGLPAWAQTNLPRPVSGKHFLPLTKPAPVQAPAGKIEVLEFFRYDCPHCNAFEPTFVEWIQSAPPDVAIRRVPVAFEPSQAGLQLLFYALQAMAKLDELHPKVFKAIHVDHVAFKTLDDFVAWGQAQGLDPVAFKEALSSFSVVTNAHKAQQLMDIYKVAGVPALGVAGRFYTDGELAGSNEKALLVAAYLVGEVRRGR